MIAIKVCRAKGMWIGRVDLRAQSYYYVR
jgi:hypothetical protein